MRLKEFLRDGGRKYNDPYYDKTDNMAAQKVGVPLDVLRAIRLAGEKSNEDQVSSAGAKGVYQFIPSVRNSVLKKYGVDAWNPEQSSLAAAYLLKENADRNNGNYNLAVREYHGGIDRKNWGKVNQAYIGRVQGFTGGNQSVAGNDIQTNWQKSQELRMPSDMQRIDFDTVKQQARENPAMMEMFNPDVQVQLEESIRLQNEKERQEQIKSQYEYQNLQIQQALQEKQEQRNQILSMIPQSSFVGGASKAQANPLTLMQKGGWIPFSQRSVNPAPIKQFYNDMINAPWYKERLEKNGYNSKMNPANWFGNGAEDEAAYRSRRVQHTKVNKIDETKLPYSAEENIRYRQLAKNGTHWDERKNEVNYRLEDPFLDENSVEPYDVMAHELGHAESAGRLNDYERELLTSRLSKATKKGKDEHDKSPEENKADIDTLRYNLHRKGLYDPKTGKYKTKTGKFEDSLLETIDYDFIIKRLRKNYDKKDLEFLVNTIAQNEPTNQGQNNI